MTTPATPTAGSTESNKADQSPPSEPSQAISSRVSSLVSARVSPRGTLELLSQREIDILTNASMAAERSEMFEMFRRCALAVLNTGNEEDNAAAIFERYADFSVEFSRRTRGLKLMVRNAPKAAFVNGKMIEGVREHLFAALRDIVYIGTEIETSPRYNLTDSAGITDAVFHLLRHARLLNPELRPNLVVCWGGHSISRAEYDYTKKVGYHLGLRGLDICTGCGPGAMKGPMKGASIGHAKQRTVGARYIGLTEPGIIAAESPNPMVNHLVIMPDIEKRLEAFVRLGHCIIVFPGGAGTAEEVLYLLGILMDPANAEIQLPLIFTGPKSSAEYFEKLDHMIGEVLGDTARAHYQILVGDPKGVARRVARSIKEVRNQRRRSGDAFYYNWKLHIPPAHQQPFPATHEAVSELALRKDMPAHELAVNLRRAFSAIVSGNVKADGIRRVREQGPFEIRGDAAIAQQLDELLRAFVAQKRMKLPGSVYEPCYRVIAD